MAGHNKQIWEAIAACFQANEAPLTKAQVLAWVGSAYPDNDFHLGYFAHQLYRSCSNVPTVQQYNAPKILDYNRSGKTYVLHDRVKEGAGTVQENQISGATDDEESEDTIESTFALEAHLREYLVRNLPILEKGLALWSLSPPSVELTIGNRRIDLLARDLTGLPVVIELKLNRGYDRVIGQALLYRGLVARHLGTPRVRIILVAAEVSEELKLACSHLLDVALFEYSLSMQVIKVSSLPTEE